MSTIRIGRAVWIIVLLGVVLTSWYVLRRGFSARTAPNRIEAFIAPRLRNIAIPSNARQAKNPIELNPGILHEAMEHFADHCAFCHASDGSGHTPAGDGLYPKPPDMRQAATQNLTDGELYYIIENGVRFTGMPAFGESDNLQDEDTWKLVAFIRHIPAMTPDEVQHVEEMTPKSAMDLQREQDIQKFLQGDDDSAPPEENPHHTHEEK